MKRMVFGLVLATALALACSGSASANYWRHCGSQAHLGAGWYYVKAHNLHCGKARRVARSYWHSFDSNSGGFSCSSKATGVELSRVFCRRELNGRVQKVRFTVGA
jgi:hypothetical protein